MTKNALVATLLALTVAAIGCSNDDGNGESQPDATNQVDAGHDSVVTDSAKDTSTPVDSAKDTTTLPDTTPDTTPETIADASDSSGEAASDTADSTTDVADASDTSDAAPCPPGQWRDFVEDTCVDCADTPIFVACTDFDFGASSWDDAASTIHVVLRAGVAQITSATVHYADYTATTSTLKTATAVVTGNDIAAVLSIDAGTTSINIGSIDVTEECGGSGSPATDINLVPAEAGGYTATFDCAL